MTCFRSLTFDMSGGAKGAKRPLGRPLDGGVRRHDALMGFHSFPSALRSLGPYEYFLSARTASTWVVGSKSNHCSLVLSYGLVSSLAPRSNSRIVRMPRQTSEHPDNACPFRNCAARSTLGLVLESPMVRPEPSETVHAQQ